MNIKPRAVYRRQLQEALSRHELLRSQVWLCLTNFGVCTCAAVVLMSAVVRPEPSATTARTARKFGCA
jgi:hypothetical protein